MSDADEQFERIKSVFGLSEIPDVTDKTIDKYLSFLKENLVCPCTLTGIESMGYFGWEERFEFGYGTEHEYNRLRKERGSYHDEYQLKTISNAVVEEDWDIIVQVHRLADKKQHKIPLSELQAVDEDSDNYWLLNDYTVWYVNWR